VLFRSAAENPLVPPQVAEQMKKLENAFEKAAVDPLKRLAEEIRKAADPKQQDTRLPKITKQAERVQKDLEAIQKRMDALARAQRDSREDSKQALQELKKDLLEQNADLTRDALQELRDYLAKLQADLNKQQNKEQDLLKDSLQELASEALRKALELQRDETAKKSNKDLKTAKELLGAEPKAQAKTDGKNQASKKKNDLADPLMPPGGEPVAKDADDPQGENQPKDASQPKDQANEGLPDLEGLKADVDPKFQKLLKDLEARMKKRQADGKPAGDPEQLKRLENLNQAQQALKNSDKSLEALREQIQSAQQKSAQSQQQPTSQQQKALDEIEKALQQPLMARAREMMRRMQKQKAQQQKQDPQQANQQAAQQKSDEPMPPPSTLANALVANENPDGEGTESVLVDLDKLDVETRRVILKMQPREREELLQGLREEGPKAYRGFIRDYFKKLSRARAKGPVK
jgi:exonuclease VII large subunit